MMATSSPRSTERSTSLQRVHLARPGAVRLRYLAQFECARHGETSIVRVGSSDRAVGENGWPRSRQLLQADISGVEPADDRLQPEELGVGDQRKRHVVLCSLGLDPGVALHDLDHLPAVHLQDLVHVDPGDLEGDEHLDHELIARRRDEVRRRAKPVRQLVGAGGGDPVPLCFCDRSPPASASTRPSRSRRCSVVYTCPTLSGHTSPVRASNSFCSRRPYFGLLAQEGEEGVRDALASNARARY